MTEATQPRETVFDNLQSGLKTSSMLESAIRPRCG
jgi:hypothetical protein